MDPQEVKNILKSAKESIKNKDFKEALRLCKSIIDKDKENYLAWVMTAAAAQELGNRDQALAAFHRAIQISSEQAPAWQGLAQFYEKANMQSDLVSVYSQLRKIFANDPDKSFDYSIKYSNVLAYQGKKSEAVTVLYSLFTSGQKGKDMKPVLENLAKLLADKSINDKPSDIYFKVIEASKSSQIDADIIKKIDENALIAMKRDQIDWKLILEKCFVILEDSANNESVLKTLIHIYHECLIGKIELDQSIEEKIDGILKSESCKEIGMFEYTKSISEAIREVDKLNPNNVNEFKIRLDEIEKLSLTNEHRIVKAFIETTYNSFICNFKKTIESSGQGLKFLQETIVDEIRPILQGKFLFSTGFMYFSHHDFKNAIENFKKILVIDSKKAYIHDVKQEAKRYLLESYLRANEKSAAIELNRSIGKDESNSNLCDLIYSYYSKESSLETSFDLAKQVVSKYPESYDSNYMLAKIASDLILHFKELNNDEYRGICLQANIKAIKLSPYKWEAIFQLGNYYGKILKDNKKALKCYQKAFELCQNLDICGLELVDALLNEKEEDIAFNILKKAIEEIENCKWASLRLGVIYLKNGEANEAIKLFHSVIRNDPNDSNIWECLADAYLNRGSPLAALKSFAKATELNPDSTYSFYKIAHIKQSLNLFEEAVMDYFAVLNKITNHVPTFKGLGETYYELAKANIKTSSDNKYLEYVELSIKYLVKAICLRKDLCCLWKILGDCCLLITTFPRCDINISVPKSILEKDFSLPDTELCKPNKLDLLKLAEECYIICCKFKPDIGSYWYDLGLCYIYQYIFLSSPQNSAVHQMESNELTDILLKARDCLVNSVNIEPENHEFWNLLAILYSRSELNKPHLAQHCFLKSLKANDSDAITWTNLGVFYLIHDRTGDNFLAHECFKKSQAIDPEYNVAWIGQAFIAEKVEKIEESIDLYRHSVELGLHTESQYGYARIVCKIFTHPILRGENIYKDYIEFLNAIPLASDCLVKYCDRIIDNPEAYFLCGVLYQKLNLPLTSIKYYESVFELVKDDSSEIVALARRGYARLLCEQKEYESALLQYKMIDVKNSVEDIFALAKVFYQLGKYQQCTKIFESALSVCTEKETSIVYTAMGMSQSKYNIQEAISSFFKSFQCKEKCIQSLFALCSIGLLKKDKALINAVFKELDTIVDIKYKFDIAKLKSIYFCLEKDYQKAIKCLSKYVHEHPNDAQSWIELCLCLKRSKNYDLALTVAYGTFQTSNQANLIFYECIQFLLLQKLKLSNYLDDDLALIKMFQKTLHIFPSHISSWGSFSQFLNSYKSKAEDFKQISARIDAALGVVQS